MIKCKKNQKNSNEEKIQIHKFTKSIPNTIIGEIHSDSINNEREELSRKKESMSNISFSPDDKSYSQRIKQKKNIKIGIEFDDYTTNNFYNNTANFQPLKEEEEDEKIYLKKRNIIYRRRRWKRI